MTESGIIQDVLRIKKVRQKEATHFALCNGEQIRYLIDLHGGKRRLSQNIASYSSKLSLLMKFINILPLFAFRLLNLGYFASVDLEYTVRETIRNTKTKFWNVIVGTYDEKQKLVIQCFNETCASCYVKIGNIATNKEMKAEIEFLAKEKKYRGFDIPKLIGYSLIDNGNRLNIQITSEFSGEKVAPVLTKEIVDIYKELSSEQNGELEFSHGDFAPWNLKLDKERLTLFDWEHCDYRMAGFDLMHYAMVIEIVTEGKDYNSAYDASLLKVKEYYPDFKMSKKDFLDTFLSLRKQIG